MIRKKGSTWIVEPYDPATRKKRLLKVDEIHDLGFRVPKSEREAKRVERAWLTSNDAGEWSEETCDDFAKRWTRDYPRSPSSNKANGYRVSKFIEEFEGRPLKSVTRTEARRFAQAYPDRYNAIRSMFSDAVKDRLLKENPFSALDIDKSKGRADVIIPSQEDVHELSRLAYSVLKRESNERFAQDMSAFVLWAAYTATRAGEACASRYSKLDGDVYRLDTQWNARLREETAPKNGSTGTIFVPYEAREAVLRKPRSLDDYMFHSPRGVVFKYDALIRHWGKIRTAFVASLERGHPLYERLVVQGERLTMHELRHFGGSHMLNELGLDSEIIAIQFRHKDGGKLIRELYGHRKREGALDRIRLAYGDRSLSSRPAYGDMSPVPTDDLAQKRDVSF